jgi:predicted acyltransferase
MNMDPTKRLLALDVFRGLTVAFMILVNNAGSLPTAYTMLTHAKWHGCTPTDLVFPFFLFIVGVAVTFSLAKHKEEGTPVFRKIVTRTAWIVGIGVLLNGAPGFDLATWRIPGVLTRIGIVYGLTAMVFMKTSARQQFWVAVGCLLSYWTMMTLIPVPGQGYASLDEGRDLGAWLDRIVFGSHLYSETRTWDPEGLLSTIPSIATCMAGALAGTWIRKDIEKLQKWSAMFAIGFLLIALGLLWGEVFPINKKIWTSSYVLYHSGLALLTLGTLWWIVDLKGWRAWAAPFVWFGMNPLLIYIIHVVIFIVMFSVPVGESTAYSWVWENFYRSWLPANLASLLFALTHVAVNLFIAWAFYKRKVFVKV